MGSFEEGTRGRGIRYASPGSQGTPGPSFDGDGPPVLESKAAQRPGETVARPDPTTRAVTRRATPTRHDEPQPAR